MESEYLARSGTTERVIAHVKGEVGGPLVVVTAGLHGNEPSGIVAVEQLAAELGEQRIKGEVLALAGNLQALQQRTRCIDVDLNRVWTQERAARDLAHGPLSELGAEAEEFHALNTHIQALLSTGRPIHFVDLHTTSSRSVPFITMSDTPANRDFVEGIQLPVVFGIEDHLEGPLLGYLAAQGHVALAFEGGDHRSPNAVLWHRDLLLILLKELGCIDLSAEETKRLTDHLVPEKTLQSRSFHIKDKVQIPNGQLFQMLPGYRNFERVKAGQDLALLNGTMQRSSLDGRLFMPLYQKKGNEGYFLIQESTPRSRKLNGRS